MQNNKDWIASVGRRPPVLHRGWIEIVGVGFPVPRARKPRPYGVAPRLDRNRRGRRPRRPIFCGTGDPSPTALPQGWIERSLSLWERWHAERDGEGERQSEDTYALSVLAYARTALPKGEPNRTPFPIHPVGDGFPVPRARKPRPYGVATRSRRARPCSRRFRVTKKAACDCHHRLPQNHYIRSNPARHRSKACC